jgi:hypothetical protein
MTVLTREQILERRLKVERVTIPGTNDEILVRAAPIHVVEKMHSVESPDYGADAYVFVQCVVGEDGKRLYKDEDAALIAQTIERGLLLLVSSKAISLGVLPKEVEDEIKKNWKSLPGAPSGA